jgi:vacuolar-type H+-ATPase subunit H
MKNMANFEEKTDIEKLISQIEDAVNGSAPMPFGGGRVLVDRERINGYAREAKAKIPEDIKKARKLIEQKDKILVSANDEAKNIIQKAQIEAEKLTAQDVITKQAGQRAMLALEKANEIAQNKITAANEDARKIIEKARMDAMKINADTTKYINDIIEHVDNIVANSINGLSTSLKELRESKLIK